MSLYYFDASALVKYYIREPGSTWVRGLIDAHMADSSNRANTVFISEASITECAAAFAILYRTQRLGKRAQDGAFRALMRDITRGEMKIVPVITIDFQFAAHLTQSHPLKAYDAVQLAVAVRHSQALATHHLSIIFVGGDKTLLEAALAEGLVTNNPFDHIMLQDTPP